MIVRIGVLAANSSYVELHDVYLTRLWREENSDRKEEAPGSANPGYTF